VRVGRAERIAGTAPGSVERARRASAEACCHVDASEAVMNGERPPGRLPEALTRLLAAPKSAIWPTPDDPHRLRLGRQRPRHPSWAIRGVWLWALLYNLFGFAILATLWWTMH
jgi:hypothetical protein